MKYIRTTFAALVGTAVVVAALAVAPIPAQASTADAPASAAHLVSSQVLTQLSPDHFDVTPEVEVCVGSADEPEFNSVYSALTSIAYIHGCIGTPTSCIASAHLLARPASGGTWTAIAIGNNATGCTPANASVTSAPCKKVSTDWSYLTEGFYKVVWPDGFVDEEHNESDVITAPYQCGTFI
jgi:hypothetical protein